MFEKEKAEAIKVMRELLPALDAIIEAGGALHYGGATNSESMFLLGMRQLISGYGKDRSFFLVLAEDDVTMLVATGMIGFGIVANHLPNYDPSQDKAKEESIEDLKVRTSLAFMAAEKIFREKGYCVDWDGNINHKLILATNDMAKSIIQDPNFRKSNPSKEQMQ